MKIIKILSYIIHPSKFIVYLGSRNIIKISDEKFLKLKYKNIFNKKLDLDNPKSFNEKLQYLKLNDRKEIYTSMVDKYEAKNIISKIIGNDYIIPNIGVYNSFDEIDFSVLPNSFVLKCTNDSGGVFICKDKEKLNIKELEKKVNKRLKKNFYYISREWPYKNIKPRIIIEKYLDMNPIDYKLMCFNGKVELVFVCSERTNKNVKIDIFDRNWNLTRVKRKKHDNSKKTISKPKNYQKMIEIAELFAKEIPFIRVDFYEINNKLYFGEFTFYPAGGFEKFESDGDYLLGTLLKVK